MKIQEKIWTYFALVIGVPVLLFVLVSWFESRVSGLPILGPDKHKVGDFKFTDQHGQQTELRHFQGKIVVANYFFTHCPVVCPRMSHNLQTVQNNTGNDVIIASFTVDPEHDDVTALKRYANKYGAGSRWKMLTGGKKDLYRFARNDLMIVATDGDGGETDFIHSENLVLIDPNRNIRGFYQGTKKSDTEQLIRDINKLRKEFQLD